MMDKIRKPEREVCVHKDADNEPDCCDCFFHNRLCDEWEAYHKSCIKQMIEKERDTLRRIIEECTSSDERLNYEIGREIVEHQPAYKIVGYIKKVIRDAILRRL